MIPIVLDHLTKRFGDLAALDGIDLRIEAGEIFFLLGPSGCGKTTLLRSIAGFYRPDSGRILFGDEDVTHLPPHRRDTGMMFQSYALWPHMTVAENVSFGLEERRIEKAERLGRVAGALDSVKMTGFGTRRIHQLSGGQQQRVALARALVIRPRCLLLDEPLSNLDAGLRIGMRSEIRRICREAALTAIYVTHDQKEALSIADRMAVMENGILRQVGTPAALYRNPSSSFVARFMGETNILATTVARAEGQELTLDTPFGQLSAISSGCLRKMGDPVSVSIRPESWRLSEERPPVNAVKGRLAERTYLGDSAQYRFANSAGEMLVSESNPRFVETSSEREVYASVSPDDIVILGDA